MSSLLIYMLKSGLAMGLFYLIYRLFLERDTQFARNRVYLMGTLMLSIVLPLIPLPSIGSIRPQVELPVYFINLEEVVSAPVFPATAPGTMEMAETRSTSPVKTIYLAGMTGLFLLLGWQTLRLILMKRAGKRRYGPLYVIFVENNISPFSFFNRVFVSRKKQGDEGLITILEHEHAHYRHGHFWDLLLLECINIFQWINPFTWLYTRLIKEVHEYQADAAVLRNGNSTGRYQALLVNQLTGTEVFRLSNGFSKSLTKKRLIMMSKISSHKNTWMKVLISLPVLALLVIAFGANASGDQNDGEFVYSGKVVDARSDSPLPGAHVIWEGHTEGTTTDAKGRFGLRLPVNNARLVYSFVGFETMTTNGTGPHVVRMKSKVITLRFPENVEEDEAPAESVGEGGEVYTMVEDLARFPGGKQALKKYLSDNIRYPDDPKEGSVSILTQFTVETDGSVSEVRILRSFNKAMDREAIRLIAEMPQWEPARQHGRAVRSRYKLPVKFDRLFGAIPLGYQEHEMVSFIVEEMPGFEGAYDPAAGKDYPHFRRWIRDNIQYPEEARLKGIEGKVYVQFMVNRMGEVNNVKVVRGVHPLLDQEAVRVISASPDWVPGRQRGIPVNIQFTFPVEFDLSP